ncbi:MAG: hypothetical protein NTY42_02920 [Planctomycetota bacterium]|nr:hypothetical protein [Planctomycetota bacterium]
MPKAVLALLSSLLLLTMLGGCYTAPKEEEEEEHFPPHWPVTVFEASKRLKQISDSDGAVESKATSIEREFVDLMIWLPELVADSDMTKTEFDEIDSWASKLASEGEMLLGKDAKIAELLRLKGLQESLVALQKLCGSYAAKMPPVDEESGVK